MDYLLPNPARMHPLSHSHEDCRLCAVVFTHEANEFVVVLKNVDSGSVFVLPTGYLEATMIYNAAKKTPTVNPTTYQLMTNIIHDLGGAATAAVVDGYDEHTHKYQCNLLIAVPQGELQVHCRLSDAIGISLYANIPIKINTAFLGKVEE